MRNTGCVWENVFNAQLTFLRRLAVNAALLTITLLLSLPAAHAQLSGSLAGVVTDPSGSVVPNAKITLTNQASQERREITSNNDGYFAFAAVLPGSYTVKVEAPSFKAWQQTDVIMHPGDTRSVNDIHLEVGTATEIVEVVASATSVVPVDSGARESLLSQTEINDIPLVSRNLSELLKILPGATTVQNGTSGGSQFVGNFLSLGLTGSTIGVGLDINGAAYRGGTGYTLDGANILDPGCNCWSTALVDPDMTQEVQVQSSNFGADVQQGPEIVNVVGKSGTREYHGQAYLYARNDVLNPNDWVDNHNGNARGHAYYYYPGASFGGPVPFTRKKVFFWFGYEHAYQNVGSSASLKSYIPATGMLNGIFNSTDPTVAALCPNLGPTGNDTSATPVTGEACSSINGMILPNGTAVTNGVIPASFVNSSGALNLEKIWPAPNVNPATNGGYNYFKTFPTNNNLYWFRPRVDYDLNDSNKFFVSFQYGRNSAPAGGTGAHIWFTPNNAIPFPGGGVQTLQTTKLATGHFVHVFNSSTTNEFFATWSWDNNPNTADVTPVSRTTTGYAYGTVFKNPAITMIPSINSPANEGGSAFTFPDFSQPDFFDPGLGGSWLAKKQSPSFADNVTKVFGSQTIKFGAYYQNVGNLQGGFNYPNGVLTFGGQNPDFFNPTGPAIGSSINPLADLVAGIASNYQEASGEPYQDMAYRIISGYFDDSYKVTRRLTIQFGVRLDHLGHWYDRQGIGMAAFFPNLVVVDEANDRPNPGVRYHGIDPGVPISGSPSRFAFISPRFGVAYDVFGDSKTVIRGGWGAYRWNDQVNDFQGALETSQNLLTYNLPHGSNVLLSEIGNLPAPVSGLSTPGAINGSIYATDPNDYNVPVTYSYNFTISHELPWRSLFEIAYVGSDTEDILTGGQNGIGNLGGGGAGSFIDRNKMPLGALFQPDPVTGLKTADPENPSKTCLGAVCNQYVDYYPYRLEYGTNSVVVPEHNGYANYNALQLMWAKSAGHLNFNVNYTWSKALGTGLGINPYSMAGNYGVLNIDRSHVINTSYVYNLPDYYHGESKFVHGATAGWMIAGTTTWQSGGNLAANYSPNLGFNMKYVCGPADPASCATDLAAYGSTTIGSATYFGTTAVMSVVPDTPCNPTSGLASSQVAKLSCFAPPAIAGGAVSTVQRDLPYINLGAYWNSDLSISKTFHVTERQAFEIRASANNWLNHPLRSITGNDQFQLNYTKDFVTGAILATPASTDWGQLNWKVGGGNQRIMELSAKYSF
jgi:hypothetical protein